MMGVIYGRILARLEPPILQRHCSLVFNDELQAISAELREVAAAYERLQEVREAVATLENGPHEFSGDGAVIKTRCEVGRCAAVEKRGEDGRGVVEEDTEVPHKAEKEKRKRRRRDLTNEDEQKQKEQPEVEYEQPEPASPEKKSKKSQNESAAMEATETRKALMSATWPSSDTESEVEEKPDSRGQLSSDEWAALVLKASRAALRLRNRQKQPSVELPLEDVSPVVDSLTNVLGTLQVPLPAGVSWTKLENGRFNNLIVLTIRALDRVAQDPLVASLANTILSGIERLIARDSALKGLRKHTNDLVRIREKMITASSESSTPAEPKPAPPSKVAGFDWSSWRERLDELARSSSQTWRDGHELSLAEVSSFAEAFRETVRMLPSSEAANVDGSIRDKFLSVISCAARVFECPGVTKEFLPTLNKVMFAIDDLVNTHSKYKCLRRHSQKLLAIRSQATNRHEDDRRTAVTPALVAVNTPKEMTPASADNEIRRFENLLSVADELMALQLSERRGRVSNYVFTLQKELMLVFPTEDRSLTSSRRTYKLITGAVKKAIKLIQDEPHNDYNDTFYEQFLELLDTIGGSSHFKKTIARSRDDLYFYLYPDSTPTNKKETSKPKPTDAETSQSTSTQQIDENSPYEELQAAYKKAHSWDHDVFSLKEFDDVMRVLRGVMAINTKTWRVRRDRTVSGCLGLMAQRAHAIKKKEHRDGRLASLAQWQKLMEV